MVAGAVNSIWRCPPLMLSAAVEMNGIVMTADNDNASNEVRLIFAMVEVFIILFLFVLRKLYPRSASNTSQSETTLEIFHHFNETILSEPDQILSTASQRNVRAMPLSLAFDHLLCFRFAPRYHHDANLVDIFRI